MPTCLVTGGAGFLGSHLCDHLLSQGGDTCSACSCNTFRPRMRPAGGRAIGTFMPQALTDRPLTVFGAGSQPRRFCYVDALIRGLVLLAESGVHAPINLGNPGE